MKKLKYALLMTGHLIGGVMIGLWIATPDTHWLVMVAGWLLIAACSFSLYTPGKI